MNVLKSGWKGLKRVGWKRPGFRPDGRGAISGAVEGLHRTRLFCLGLVIPNKERGRAMYSLAGLEGP